MIKKILVVTLLFAFILSPTLIFGTIAHADGIYDAVKNSSSAANDGLTSLEKQADDSGAKLVSTVRRIGLTASVIILIMIGYSFWKGNAQSLADAKGKILLFFLGLFIAFGAEKIIGTALNLFGITIK
ncbi:MAG: hypothetical protein ACH0QD_04435 [Tepidibacillus sp.]